MQHEGNDRIRGMQVNLITEIEMQSIKDPETIKNYSDRLLRIVNKVRIHGTDFSAISATRIVHLELFTFFVGYKIILLESD